MATKVEKTKHVLKREACGVLFYGVFFKYNFASSEFLLNWNSEESTCVNQDIITLH